MSPQEIEKLLGGYATDTLTEEERRTLFTAALGSQVLFDALADEQALRELLQDPPSRAQLLASLRAGRVSPMARLAAWLRRPSVVALAAAVAAGIVTVAVVIPRKTAKVMETAPAVAMSRPQEPVPPLVLKTTPQREAAPKPAPPAPAGSPAKDEKSAALQKQRAEPERDVLMEQNARGAGNAVATSAPAAPPPPPQAAPVVVAPAQSQFKESVEIQAAQPKLADAVRPTAVTRAAPAPVPQEARKKEAAPGGARDLYYSTQAGAVGGMVSEPKTAKAKQDFGRALSVRRAATPPAAAVFAVRYSILRRNPDGAFVEVDPSTVFAPGDALRLRFETNQAGNLAVMERQGSGAWTLRLGARTQPGEPVYMPSESALNITAGGGYRFFVKFSRSLRSEPRLDQIAPTANLLRESAANSVYVANPVAGTDPTVDFELAINAK